MNKKIVISLFILITLCLSNTNLNKPSISKTDTIYVPVLVDTIHFNIVSKDSNTIISWLKRNEASLIGAIIGAFLGAIGAGFVAYYSIKRTHLNNIEIEKGRIIEIRKEKDKKYCGLLFMIISEIYFQKKDTELIEEEIERFIRVTKEQKRIITDNPFTLYQLDMLNECRNRILDYDSFDTELVSTISLHINTINKCNSYLYLKPLIDLERFKVEGELNIVDDVESYFSEVKIILGNINKARIKLTMGLTLEIAKFPSSNINPDDLMKKLYPEYSQ